MPTADALSGADALLVVDMQNDFCPGGALAVPGGDEVIPELNRWMSAAAQAGAFVVATRDWHTVDHCSFEAQGGPWPPHCVQGTSGAEFHPGLVLPPETILVSKGTAFNRDAYSAFDATGLEEFLHRKGVTRVWIGGLAQDVCVLETVKDACRHGFETHVLCGATRAVFPQQADRAWAEMKSAGAHLEAA